MTLMTCAVCQSRLNWKTNSSGTGWVHPDRLHADHVVVPVTEEQMAAAEVCDFCLATDVVTEFHADPTAVVMAAGDHQQVEAEDGEWAACEKCAALVRAHDLDGLMNRVTKIFTENYKMTPDRPVLRHTYKAIIDTGKEARR